MRPLPLGQLAVRLEPRCWCRWWCCWCMGEGLTRPFGWSLETQTRASSGSLPLDAEQLPMLTKLMMALQLQARSSCA